MIIINKPSFDDYMKVAEVAPNLFGFLLIIHTACLIFMICLAVYIKWGGDFSKRMRDAKRAQIDACPKEWWE